MQFDRFLAPASTVRQAICVQSCSVGPSAQCDGQCIGGLSPEYDPVDRVVVWKNAPITPGLRYNVRLLVPQNDSDPNGIRSIDGAPLDKEYVFAFTAGDPSKMPPDLNAELVEAEKVVGDRADMTKLNFCSTNKYCPVPTSGCAMPSPDFYIRGPQEQLNYCSGTASCHGPTLLQVKGGPAGSALTLTDRDGGTAGAIARLVGQGVVATETAVAPDPLTPHRGPSDVFGVNMPVIDPTIPGNSYVLYKIILGMAPRCVNGVSANEESANPNYATYSCTAAAGQLEVDNFLCSDITCKPEAGADRPDAAPPGMSRGPAPPFVPAWIPDDKWKPPVEGEYARLRTRIRGDGMPPPQTPEPVPVQNARAISAWIAAGAKTMSCP